MVNAKHARNREVLAKFGLLEAKTAVDDARLEDERERAVAQKKKREEEAKATLKPKKRSKRLAKEEFESIFLEKDGGGEVVIRGSDGELLDASELRHFADDVMDMDIPEQAGKGVAAQNDLHCNYFAPCVVSVCFNCASLHFVPHCAQYSRCIVIRTQTRIRTMFLRTETSPLRYVRPHCTPTRHTR